MEQYSNSKTHHSVDYFGILYFIIGVPWLFLMLTSTRVFSSIKAIMLIMLTIIAALELLLKNIKMEKNHLIFIICYVAYNSLLILIGLLSGFAFSLSQDFSLIQYYILTPVCVLCISYALAKNNYRIQVLWRIVEYLTLLLCVLDVLKVGAFAVNINIPFLDFIVIASDNIGETLTLRVANEASFMFLSPIFIFLLFNVNNKSKRNIILYGLITFLSIIYAFISGRKMLEIILALAGMFSVAYRIYKCIKCGSVKELKKFLLKLFALFVVFVIATAIVSNILGIDNIIQKVWNTLKVGFSSQSDGISKRTENSLALLKLWTESPIWGNGLQSYARDSLASDTTLWSYEVFFVAYLAQTGLIGVVMLMGAMLGIIKPLCINKESKNRDIPFAIAVGFVSFVICGATNPMLYYAWPWIISMAFGINNKKEIVQIFKEEHFYKQEILVVREA